jgi:hypothetical protein
MEMGRCAEYMCAQRQCTIGSEERGWPFLSNASSFPLARRLQVALEAENRALEQALRCVHPSPPSFSTHLLLSLPLSPSTLTHLLGLNPPPLPPTPSNPRSCDSFLGSRSKFEAERIVMEQRLKAAHESERRDLEGQYQSRLSQIRAELEDEERMQKRKMVDATDLLVAEFKRQMEVRRGAGGGEEGRGMRITHTHS